MACVSCNANSFAARQAGFNSYARPPVPAEDKPSRKAERISFLERKREAHRVDLQLKFEDSDWRGVADAAMDLRDVDCELAGLRFE